MSTDYLDGFTVDPDRETRLVEWSRGFHACWDYLAPQLDRANREADYWYFRANNPGAVAAQRARDESHLRMLAARAETAARWAALDAADQTGDAA